MMQLINEFELELGSVPFSERDDEVTYFATGVNPHFDAFVQKNIDTLEKIFEKECLKFSYIIAPMDCNAEPVVACGGDQISDKRIRAYHLDTFSLQSESLIIQQFEEVARAYSRRNVIDYHQFCRDNETRKMLIEMERLARALSLKGVKTELFDAMIQSLSKPVQMEVCGYKNLVFPELGGMKIHLYPIEFTLYNLFLKHPEGIHPDAIIGHRTELINIYSRASRFEDCSRVEGAIDSLCSEDKGVLYSNISKIKTNLCTNLGSRMAEHYIIQKHQDGLYSISIPQSLVTWRC